MSGGTVLDLAWIVPALPLAGAVVLIVSGRRIGVPGVGWLATATVGVSFGWSLVVLAALASRDASQRQVVVELFTWIRASDLDVTANLLVDPLSVTMALFVTGVGALIHLYSIGYMRADRGFTRYFAYLNLFVAAMLLLVLGGSLVVTFVGWEGVGVCSYLLIAFWFERPAAATAGKKAFLTNRVGDVGFLLAMLLIFASVGSLDYAAVLPAAGSLPPVTATAAALLLFLAAAGKSAQLPLHVWLPEAMEGPTPASALIHAATMVTAGVYLVVRMHPLFQASAIAGDVVAWVGAATALMAASVALVHNDIKRVLAYSTISQLGYMFLAAGIGAYGAAVFHMVTNAFFKALLFLGAGSVIHGLGGEQDMRRMGGLRRVMPVTTGVFIVAWLAIAGIFPFAGFWSKDEILAVAYRDRQYGLWVAGVVGALVTAFYMARQVRLVFYGDQRWEDTARPHESPLVMTAPMVVLAALTVLGGLLNLPFQSLEWLTRWLEPTFAGVAEPEGGSFAAGAALAALASGVSVVGIGLAFRLYRRGLTAGDPLASHLGPAAGVLERAYGIDGAYAAAAAGPARRLAWVATTVEGTIIDGAVNGTGRLVRAAGERLRRLQSGLVRRYALGIALGAVLLLAWALLRTG